MQERTNLAAIRRRVLSRADMPANGFVPNSELDDFIHDSLDDLHEMLVGKHEGYAETSATLTLAASTSDYVLPNDFLKLIGVDLIFSGSDYTSLRRIANPERNRDSGSMRDSLRPFRYSLRGRFIRIHPTPAAAYTGRILYAPTFTPLRKASDKVPAYVPAGFLRWAVLDAAIKCLLKEESDTSALERERERIEAKINAAAVNRDSNEPTYIADVRGTSPRSVETDEEWL